MKNPEPFPAVRAFMRKRLLLATLAALSGLGSCAGTTGDVLTLPDLGVPLGAVPAGCLDDRQGGSVCFYEAGWLGIAERACQGAGLSRVAQIYLDACGPGFYRGVYYRCCTG